MSTTMLATPPALMPAGPHRPPQLRSITVRAAKAFEGKFEAIEEAKILQAIVRPTKWKKLKASPISRVHADRDFRICYIGECIIDIDNHKESDLFVKTYRPVNSPATIPLKEFLMKQLSKAPIANLDKAPAVKAATVVTPVPTPEADSTVSLVRELKGLMQRVAKEDVDAMRDLICEEYDSQFHTHTERMEILEQQALAHGRETETLRADLKQLHEQWTARDSELLRRLTTDLAETKKRQDQTQGHFGNLGSRFERGEANAVQRSKELEANLLQSLAQNNAEQQRELTAVQSKLVGECIKPMQLQSQQLQDLKMLNAQLVQDLAALSQKVSHMEEESAHGLSFRWVTEGWQKVRGWWSRLRGESTSFTNP